MVTSPQVDKLTPAERDAYFATLDDDTYETEMRRWQRALCDALHPATPLYHWSPTANRKGIIRKGLVIGHRHVTHSDDGSGWRAGYLCFGPSPSLGWALSGGMAWTPSGGWDLWQTSVCHLVEPYARVESESDPLGLYEVRTEEPVPKRHLWLVGARWKP